MVALTHRDRTYRNILEDNYEYDGRFLKDGRNSLAWAGIPFLAVANDALESGKAGVGSEDHSTEAGFDMAMMQEEWYKIQGFEMSHVGDSDTLAFLAGNGRSFD